MMKFLRANQRFVFIVTIILMIGMTFLGGARGASSPTYKEEIAFKRIDGKSVTKSELKLMAALLSEGDLQSKEDYFAAVLGTINGNFIEKEIIETGLISKIAAAHFDQIAQGFARQLNKMAQFEPYAHSSVLSSAPLWEKMLPGSLSTMQKIKERSASDQELFFELLPLYRSKSGARIVRNFLFYQQSQLPVEQRDVQLAARDFSLLGAHTIHDFFGAGLPEVVAEVVINGAALAKEKGYKVTAGQAWIDLVNNMKNSLKQSAAQEGKAIEVSDTEAQQELNARLEQLGLPQKEVVRLWENALLFKRFFHDISSCALSCPASFQPFLQFGSQSCLVTEYGMQEEFVCRTFQDFLKLQTYLAAVYSDGSNSLDFPNKTLPVEEVEKRCPQLVCASARLLVQQIDLKAVQSRITLKETWNWQLAESNFALLAKQFPVLGDAKTVEQRDAALEALQPDLRLKVDEFARSQIAKAHPEWIDQAFAHAALHPVMVDLKEGKEVLPGVDASQILSLIDAKVKKGQVAGAREKLYSIEITFADQKKVQPLKQALSDGTLERLVAEKFENEQAGKRHFSALCNAIVKDYLAHGGKKSWDKEPELAFYAQHRFDLPLRKLREQLIAEKEHSKIAAPFIALEKEVKRAEEQGELLFSLEEGVFSPVMHKKEGSAQFFHVAGKKEGSTSVKASLKRLDQQMQQEIQMQLIEELLKRMDKAAVRRV